MYRASLLGLTLLLALAISPAAAEAGAPDPAVKARTPPTGDWRVEPFAPTEYFKAAELRRWSDYRQTKRRLGLLSLGLELAFYLVLLLTGLPKRLLLWCLARAQGLGRRWPMTTRPLARLGLAFERLFGPDWHGAVLFALALYLAGNLLALPLALWQEHLAQQAGLSVYTAGAWTWDLLKSLFLGGLVFAALVFGLYGLIRRFPRRWWLVLAVPAGLGLIAYGYVEPELPRVYHDLRPLNKDDPQEREAGQRLRQLARRSGLELSTVKVIRTSRTSRALGAYVVGLSDRRELVIYDTLLREATPDELEAAVAHELGHEQHRDDWVTYGLAALALAALLWLLSVVLRRLAPRVGAQDAGDVLTLPLLAFVLWLVFTLLGPVIHYRSRVQEREADRHGLVLTGNPDAFIRLQVRLARRNRAEVRPPAWVTLWLRSHPSTYERIGTARWYRRWMKKRQADVN